MAKIHYIRVNAVELNNILNSCPSARVETYEYDRHGFGIQAIIGNTAYFINNGGNLRDCLPNPMPYRVARSLRMQGIQVNAQIWDLVPKRDKELIIYDAERRSRIITENRAAYDITKAELKIMIETHFKRDLEKSGLLNEPETFWRDVAINELREESRERALEAEGGEIIWRYKPYGVWSPDWERLFR